MINLFYFFFFYLLIHTIQHFFDLSYIKYLLFYCLCVFVISFVKFKKTIGGGSGIGVIITVINQPVDKKIEIKSFSNFSTTKLPLIAWRQTFSHCGGGRKVRIFFFFFLLYSHLSKLQIIHNRLLDITKLRFLWSASF